MTRAHKPKSNSKGNPTVSSAYDRCQTPPYAIDPLLPYLPLSWSIWEPAAGEGHLARALRNAGYSVIETELLQGTNFFTCEVPPCDTIVTNPPYSIKYDWHARCCVLGLPFALLVPLEMMGSVKAQRLMEHYGAEIILMDKRVDFRIEGHCWAESSAQFPVMWLTSGLKIGRQLTFARLNKPGKQQLAEWDLQVVQKALFSED